MTDLTTIIDQEIEDLLQTGERIDWYFNNFYGNLPYGYRRKYPQDLLGMKPDKNNSWTSEKRKSMTNAEFFQDIDNAIAEIGFDVEELKRFRELETADNFSDREDYDRFREEFCRFLLPLYVRLREKGYVKYDLTA